MAKKENYLDKFRRLALLEYISADNVLGEEGEDQGVPGGPAPDAGGQPPMDPQGQGAPEGGMPPMGGDAPQQGGPQGFAPQSMGNEDPNAGGDMNAPQLDMGMPQDPNAIGGDSQMGEPEDDVEEIDVDDLVDSQEETEKKVSKLMKKFSGAAEKMMSAVDSLSAKIDASTERLNNIEAEIAKRNPTPIEKMSLRAKDGYPFGQSVDDYWKGKEFTSNYSPEDDNDGVGEPQYTITKNDIDNISDYSNIARDLNSRKYSLEHILRM